MQYDSMVQINQKTYRLEKAHTVCTGHLHANIVFNVCTAKGMMGNLVPKQKKTSQTKIQKKKKSDKILEN